MFHAAATIERLTAATTFIGPIAKSQPREHVEARPDPHSGGEAIYVIARVLVSVHNVLAAQAAAELIENGEKELRT